MRNWIAVTAGAATLGLAACGTTAGARSAAERACYDAVANRHAEPVEISYVSTRVSANGTQVSLSDGSGLWNCLSTADGNVTDLQFDPDYHPR